MLAVFPSGMFAGEALKLDHPGVTAVEVTSRGYGCALLYASDESYLKRPPPGGPGARRSDSPLVSFIPPQLCQLVEKPPSGPRWLHEINLDDSRMAARIDYGRVPTSHQKRPRLDGQYPSAIAALANVTAKTDYIDALRR